MNSWTSWAGLWLQLWVPGLLIPWVVLRVSQLTLPYIACLFAEICFSSMFPLRYCSWRFLPFGVMVCQTFRGRWDWSREVWPPVPLALGRSSSFWLKMCKGDIWKSRACMRSVVWRGVFEMCGCSSWSRLSPPQLWCPLAVGTRNIHIGNYIEVSEHKPSGKVSVLSYTVSWVLEVNVNQLIPCFSMM